MKAGQTDFGAAEVKFLRWRTSRRVAITICLALYLSAAGCVVVALWGPENTRWLWLTGFVSGVLAGQYNNAIIRSNRASG